MKKPSKKILALPLEKRAELALKSAVKKEIERRLQTGFPVYVLRNGKVVALRARRLVRQSKRKVIVGR